jgi:hypothetical protein
MTEGDQTMQSLRNLMKLTYGGLVALPDDGLRHERMTGNAS